VARRRLVEPGSEITPLKEGPNKMSPEPTASATRDLRPFRYDLATFIPFRDSEACERARGILREDITSHPNPEFQIRVIEERQAFYEAFAGDLVRRIREARDEERSFVAILPAGPIPQYELAARAINAERLSLAHVHTFNMDEYANQDGETAPLSWAGSFQRAMLENFFGLIDEDLRPPTEQVHFPTTEKIPSYGQQIDDLGGADVCYGGIGWCGHIAFWEAHLAFEFDGDLDAYKKAGPRLVELHPMTIMQNALHSFSGDWSLVPPKANTIGPRQILGARHRSFWLDGDLGGGVSWQRFIARLVAHGPVSEFVPGSMLQTARTDFTLLGGVADDVVVQMA
jgi:glucosamine-6-phosphate deaminase